MSRHFTKSVHCLEKTVKLVLLCTFGFYSMSFSIKKRYSSNTNSESVGPLKHNHFPSWPKLQRSFWPFRGVTDWGVINNPVAKSNGN